MAYLQIWHMHLLHLCDLRSPDFILLCKRPGPVLCLLQLRRYGSLRLELFLQAFRQLSSKQLYQMTSDRYTGQRTVQQDHDASLCRNWYGMLHVLQIKVLCSSQGYKQAPKKVTCFCPSKAFLSISRALRCLAASSLWSFMRTSACCCACAACCSSASLSARALSSSS